MKCEYGCDQEAQFTLKNGKSCCSKYSNSCPAIRRKNAQGLVRAHADGRVPNLPLRGVNSKGVYRREELIYEEIKAGKIPLESLGHTRIRNYLH